MTSPLNDARRLFVVEQNSGQIRIIDSSTGVVNPTPFLVIPPNLLLNTDYEQGLLGLAFHPDYATNGRFYVNYTAVSGTRGGRTKIVEYRVSDTNPNVANPSSARDILSFDQPETNHNGGWMAFGIDGFLYISSGDGGGNGYRNGQIDQSFNSQDLNGNLLGKILRIDVNGDAFPQDPTRNYSVPASNPFTSVAGAGEIWSYGLRNPWRPSFDRITGDLYIADVGQDAMEEINFQPGGLGGQNYGWNRFEGTVPYRPVGTPESLTFPIYQYGHDIGSSITGGYVYRGPDPSLQGTYFFADFLTGRVYSFRYANGSLSEFTDRTAELSPPSGQGQINNIASFGEDSAGNLYIIDYDGDIFRINVSPTAPSQPGTAYLSDLTPVAAVNGWGPYERDRSNGESGAADGGVLTLNGTTYAKGLGVHSTSSLTYALGGTYSRFQSFIGVDDYVMDQGSVIFRVLADGTERFRSSTLTGASATQFVDLNVAGVQTLQLIVENADGSIRSDHANWADAKLIRSITDTTGPSASLTASGITAGPVGSLYTFTVRYDDLTGVNISSIDNADIRVTGPNSYSQLATRVSTAPATNTTSVTATYSIPAPGGTWDFADNGPYTVSLLPTAVTDTFGNTTAAAVLGTFAVNVPAPPPQPSTAYLSDLTPVAAVNGWGPYERDRSNGESGAADGGVLTLNGTTYAKGLGVHSTSSLTYALGGTYSRFQSFIGVDDYVMDQGSVIFRVLADGTERFRSSTLTGASATQFVDLNVAGVQTLQLIVENADGSIRSDHANWADAKLIRSITDTTGPSASLTASGITAGPAGSLYTFTVRYDDLAGVNISSIDNADISVTGPNGYAQRATRVSTAPSINTASVTATYSIPAPGGTWDFADNGSYTVRQLPTAVTDIFGNTTAAAVLGTFAVNLPAPPPQPSTAYLSDLTPVAAVNGWGPYERDRSNGESGAADGGVLTLNGTTYAKGLGVHSTSSLTYALGGTYSRFQSFIGVDDYVMDQGSVIFRVLADGTERFRSGILTGASATQFVDLNVAGVQTLQLIVENADGSIRSDHANWADAKLIRSITDTTGPSASLTASGITAGPAGSLYTFAVRYDDLTGVNISSIDNADISVTGPNGYAQRATRVSTAPSINTTSVTATYSIPAPGGTWDFADNGSYTVRQLPTAVTDIFGNTTAAAVLGTFVTALPATQL